MRRLQEWIPHICHSETEPVCYPSLPKKRRFHPRRCIHVIDYQQHADWGERLAAWTGGRGVDHVIEVGGPGTLAQSIRACQVGGHISLIGVAGDVPTAFMMVKQIRLQSLIVGSCQPQIEFVRAMEATGVRPVIDRRFRLEQIADAFRYEETGRHLGKKGCSPHLLMLISVKPLPYMDYDVQFRARGTLAESVPSQTGGVALV